MGGGRRGSKKITITHAPAHRANSENTLQKTSFHDGECPTPRVPHEGKTTGGVSARAGRSAHMFRRVGTASGDDDGRRRRAAAGGGRESPQNLVTFVHLHGPARDDGSAPGPAAHGARARKFAPADLRGKRARGCGGGDGRGRRAGHFGVDMTKW